MKIKVLVVIAVSMLFGGIVSAAGLYGTFEGYQIVRVQSNGQTLAVEDVPAVNLNGRTMVPIYMLKNLGANVSWDGETESVNVTLPNQSSNTSNSLNDVIQISKEFKPLGFEYIEMVGNGNGFYQMSFYYNSPLDNMPDDIFDAVMYTSTLSDAESTRIVDSLSDEYTILTDYLRDFYSNKITQEQLMQYFNHYSYNQDQYFPPVSTEIPILPTSNVIKSKISSDFDGFNQGNIYELDNGQLWKQVSITYRYSYKYRPDVTIYKDGSKYFMIVEGMNDEIQVELLN